MALTLMIAAGWLQIGQELSAVIWQRTHDPVASSAGIMAQTSYVCRQSQDFDHREVPPAFACFISFTQSTARFSDVIGPTASLSCCIQCLSRRYSTGSLAPSVYKRNTGTCIAEITAKEIAMIHKGAFITKSPATDYQPRSSRLRDLFFGEISHPTYRVQKNCLK